MKNHNLLIITLLLAFFSFGVTTNAYNFTENETMFINRLANITNTTNETIFALFEKTNTTLLYFYDNTSYNRTQIDAMFSDMRYFAEQVNSSIGVQYFLLVQSITENYTEKKLAIELDKIDTRFSNLDRYYIQKPDIEAYQKNISNEITNSTAELLNYMGASEMRNTAAINSSNFWNPIYAFIISLVMFFIMSRFFMPKKAVQNKPPPPLSTVTRYVQDLKLDETRQSQREKINAMRNHILQQKLPQKIKLEMLALINNNEVQNTEQLDEEIRLAKEEIKLGKQDISPKAANKPGRKKTS